jgi:hypothetical protein
MRRGLSRGIFVGGWLSDFFDLGGWLLQLSRGVFTSRRLHGKFNFTSKF